MLKRRIGQAQMQIKNSSERYGLIALLLHWSVVVLVVTQVVLAGQAEDTSSLLQKAKILTTHKSIGMTILMLAILRLLWRLMNPTPIPVMGTKAWQERLASIMHWLLYALIFLTPLVGWTMSSAKNYPVSYFGLFTWPNLVAPDEGLFNTLRTTHGVLAKIMVSLAWLHAFAALKHHFFDKDNVLRRMLPLKLK
jgi:cytochrome b561